MLMSKSRLEKFLYALYSLDYSDLPNPLSRIEELYKCLVTGEEPPTFEPLSRVEKYLMAILGVYDADSLPSPLSRVEVLLHKLATGDDNLDDIKSFLSEHEELLAEIIRNGGAGGNVDIEYVLYTLSTEFNTLYNTAEKPVKSAILKGNTLVNLLNKSNVKITSSASSNINYSHNLNTTKAYILQYRINQIPELSDVTDSARLFKFEWYSGIESGGYSDVFIENITVGTNNFIIINPFSAEVVRTNFGIWCPNYVSGNLDIDIILMEYQDGMENWDISYFEGMQSVKMPVLTTTGKNLFDINGEIITVDGTHSINGDSLTVTGKWFARQNVDLKPNTTYTLSYEKAESDSGYRRIAICTNGTSNIIGGTDTNKLTFTTPSSFKDISVIFYAEVGINTNTVTYTNIQLEEGSVARTYEPHKSNILTVNEDVTLRGVGDVQDELNVLTGELTQRIGKVVITNSDIRLTNNTNYRTETSTAVLTYKNILYNIQGKIISTDIPTYEITDYLYGLTKIDFGISFVNNSYGFCIRLPHNLTGITLSDDDEMALEKFKEYLKNNPITVYYQLTTESVKTVDLSVVDQDGNNTKLSTFNDITHVTLSSEGLIPEAELEVATKNEEVLNAMSLEMDDISETQTTLEETSNTQSENVDATMIATTEIYEGLL